MQGFINNQWDRDNLEFLLQVGDAELAEWYAQADQDDMNYAMALMAAYSNEMLERSQALDIELALVKNNFTEADNILAKFRI